MESNSVGRLSDIVHLDGLTEDEEVSEHTADIFN